MALTFLQIKICFAVGKEKTFKKFFRSDWTSEKRCVKIEHLQDRGIQNQRPIHM